MTTVISTHCRNIGHHITNYRWLQPAKDTQVIDKKKKSVAPQKKQEEKWQSKDNPDGIGSSKAFQAPEVNIADTDRTTPQLDVIPLQLDLEVATRQEEEVEDVTPISQVEIQTEPAAIPLQIEFEDTSRQVEEVRDVSIPVSQAELQTDLKMHKESTTMTFTYENVSSAIHHDKLPYTSAHVLEEINTTDIESQHDNARGGTAAPLQHSSFDVMAFEHSTQAQSRPIEIAHTTRQDDTDMNVAPARAGSIRHHEIPVTKNVQNDLDLWARIREYDQRMATEGFTQVLSKKQQQTLKKQVLGKASYKTRAKGTPPPQ